MSIVAQAALSNAADESATKLIRATIALRKSVEDPERKVTRLIIEKNAGFRLSGYSR